MSIGCFHDRPGTISGYEFLLWHGPTFISLDIRDLEILNSSKGLGQAGLISLIVLRIPILPKKTIIQETPKRGSPMARRISFLESPTFLTRNTKRPKSRTCFGARKHTVALKTTLCVVFFRGMPAKPGIPTAVTAICQKIGNLRAMCIHRELRRGSATGCRILSKMEFSDQRR